MNDRGKKHKVQKFNVFSGMIIKYQEGKQQHSTNGIQNAEKTVVSKTKVLLT